MSTPEAGLELVVWYYIRKGYEEKWNRINIPMPLKYLTLSFSKRIIGSNLMTLNEDLDFVSLLSNKIPDCRKFKLLFRASKDGFRAKDFHTKCDNHGRTICIIKSNFGNVFGGYTKVPWASKFGVHLDETAFLFLIHSGNESEQKKCPLIFPCKPDKQAVFHYDSNGPAFGTACDLIIEDNSNRAVRTTIITDSYRSSKWCCNGDYDYKGFKGSLCGGNLIVKGSEASYTYYDRYFFQVKEYQVFEIQ